MSANKFIPELWSAKILAALDKQLVYSELFNSDYDGEITEAGDTVHIAQVGAVQIKDFDCSQDIAAPDEINATDTVLKLDQAKYFNIGVCDIDAAQSKINLLDEATNRAGYGFADAADAYLGGLLAEEGKANAGLGTKAAPIVVTVDNAYEILVKMKTALDKANLPKAGRKAVVPPEFEGYMLLDPRFVAVATDDSADRLAEGTVYRAAGFEIRVSNNCPTDAKGGSDSNTTVHKVIASSPMQGTYAQQILKTEAYRPEKRFGDAVKGLHVYGAKVLRPDVVAVATVNFTPAV